MITTDNQDIFFNRIGSICTHAEEAIGSNLFIRITLQKVTVNPSLMFQSVVMYINRNGKLKISRNFNFAMAELRNDDWGDMFINRFVGTHSDCQTMLGVLTNEKNLNWYITFATSKYGVDAIERNGQSIML